MEDYAWGLGRKTNNVVEWLALLKGMEVARERGISSLTIIVDSLMVIRDARKFIRKYKSPSLDQNLRFTILSEEFQSLNFYHIM